MKKTFKIFSLKLALLLIAFFYSSNVVMAQERMETEKNFELHFGPAFPINDAYGNADDIRWNLGAGYTWSSQNLFLEARFDYHSRFEDPQLSMYSMNMGANFFVMEDFNYSMYAGGDLGLGFGSNGKDFKTGFNFGANVGAILLKDYDVNLDLRLRFQLFAVEFVDDSLPFNTMFTIGIRL